THQGAQTIRQKISNLSQATRQAGQLREAIRRLGHVNLGAVEEFQRVEERYHYLNDQKTDVETAQRELEVIIQGITEEMREIFLREFRRIQEAFAQTFTDLFGGGQGALALEDEKEVLTCGIDIRVQPPGKTLRTISLLSGGERALVAIALYFAILQVHPTPFCVMDEIEAALDESNGARFIRYLRAMGHSTQFIFITHRRETMEAADLLYGVTMERQGVSKILKLDLKQAEELLQTPTKP
ncbi:MAG: chromosome segregation protein SMC, partial [Ruminiclostridium sp.]|nr:chromosome segregation protein SMC [Ruminiclostridium sp.]